MADVYRNSYITLCASASADDSSGCFPRRQQHMVFEGDLGEIYDPQSERLIRFAWAKVPTKTSGGQPSVVTLRKGWMPSSRKAKPNIYLEDAYQESKDPLMNEPLSSRSWCLQERWLSPRKLHFGKMQVYFECVLDFLAEDGSRYESFRHCNLALLVALEKRSSSLDGIPKDSGVSMVEGFFQHLPKVGRWAGGWIDLVQDFTSRKLTYETDKLPALAGLARYLAEKTGDAYLAGLWRNHLLEDLFWRVYLRQEDTYTPEGNGGMPGQPEKYGKELSKLSIPAQWRAPSWSWASLDTRVLFLQLNFRHIVATIVASMTEPETADPYSTLKSGWLKIRVCLPK